MILRQALGVQEYLFSHRNDKMYGKWEQNCMKIMISLTSYPARITTVYKVIRSLFDQTWKADEIVLWLSTQEFIKKEEDLPPNLLSLVGQNGFRIEWVSDNLKSHKKYFYALQNNPEKIIITVDDDAYYSQDMIRTLMESYQRHPKAISARCVRLIYRQENVIADYLTWNRMNQEYIDEERMDLCAIGVSGILYPPGCASDEWFDKKKIQACAENQDDLWLKYNEVINNIPVVNTGVNGKDHKIEESQGNALFIRNARGDNDICISGLMKIMKKDHKSIYKEWFGQLMSMDEIINIKRAYCESELERVLDVQREKDIYICGAGKYAHIVMDFIRSCNKEKCIKAFLVTQSVQSSFADDCVDIKLIQDLDKRESFGVICGVGEKYKTELKAALEPYELHEWIELDILNIASLLRAEGVYE